jgi:hypothetical protein
MSYTKSYIMNHWNEINSNDDDYSYYEYLVERKKVDEEHMWYEWAENNRFALADGTLIDGKINP